MKNLRSGIRWVILGLFLGTQTAVFAQQDDGIDPAVLLKNRSLAKALKQGVQLETQGLFFHNEAQKTVAVVLQFGTTKLKLEIAPEKSAYLYTSGKFTEGLSMVGAIVGGTYERNNIMAKFRGDQPIPVISLLAKPDEFLRIGQDEARQWQLMEIPNTIKNVKVVESKFVEPAAKDRRAWR